MFFMEEIDLDELSKILSEEYKTEIKAIKLEKISSGYHSDGFKISCDNGKCFFIKRVKTKDMGYEVPERKVYSLLVGDAMSKRVGNEPRSVGVVVLNNKAVKIPEINEDSQFYHLQEFGADGVSYWSLLNERRQKEKVDENDLRELDLIVDFIAKVHSVKHPSCDREKLDAVYNDSLRSVLANPELALMLLHDFPKDDKFMPLKTQKEIVGLMFEFMHKYKNRSDRLCALHGDFWGGNAFLKDGKLEVIDFSRIPWGDAGVDVGWWFSQYLAIYHQTKNKYFKELGELFLKKYIEKTGDEEVLKSSGLVFGLLVAIYLSRRFYPVVEEEYARRFLKNVLEILKVGRIVWLEI